MKLFLLVSRIILLLVLNKWWLIGDYLRRRRISSIEWNWIPRLSFNSISPICVFRAVRTPEKVHWECWFQSCSSLEYWMIIFQGVWNEVSTSSESQWATFWVSKLSLSCSLAWTLAWILHSINFRWHYARCNHKVFGILRLQNYYVVKGILLLPGTTQHRPQEFRLCAEASSLPGNVPSSFCARLSSLLSWFDVISAWWRLFLILLVLLSLISKVHWFLYGPVASDALSSLIVWALTHVWLDSQINNFVTTIALSAWEFHRG